MVPCPSSSATRSNPTSKHCAFATFFTSTLTYHHPRGRPLKPGLAWLTKKWCHREVQTRGDGGHDPEEDARACAELLRLKVQNGAGFGEFKTDHESIFERMARTSARGGQGAVRGAVIDHGHPGVMHGAKATTAIGCGSDQEVLESLLKRSPHTSFCLRGSQAWRMPWVVRERFFGSVDQTIISLNFAGLTPKMAGDVSATTVPLKEPSPEAVAVAQATLNEQLGTLYASLPTRTALVIFTGHSDPRRMGSLKVTFESAIKSGKKAEDINRSEWWTASDGRDLEEEVEKAKRGLLFLGIK